MPVTDCPIKVADLTDKSIKCPACDGRFEFLYTIDRFNPSFTILKCSSCGLERQSDISEDQSSLYDEGYYSGRSEYSYVDERKKEGYFDYVWRARLRTIRKYVAPPARLLDVGCSFGGFVASAERLGYDATGVDISQYAVSEGRKLGRNLTEGDIFSVDGPFDVITLIEVIEHLPDPLAVIKRLYELLAAGGVLILQTANFQGHQAVKAKSNYHYYLPGHLYYYSTRSLRLLLTRAGFKTIHFYRGVDFGVIPKLRKMKGSFTSYKDYVKIWPVIWYHFKSKIAFRDFALTSSMVCYAQKPKEKTI